MFKIEAGDLVRTHGAADEMLVIGRADDELWEPGRGIAFFCVWEQVHFLHEEVFPEAQLLLIRKERRRIPRGGNLYFPVKAELGDN